MKQKAINQAQAERSAVLDATADIFLANADSFSMETQRAHVRIVQRTGNLYTLDKAVKGVQVRELDTFGAEYTDSTHAGRFCGAGGHTLAEIVEHCERKGWHVENVLKLKEGGRDVVRLWNVGDVLTTRDNGADVVHWNVDWSGIAA